MRSTTAPPVFLTLLFAFSSACVPQSEVDSDSATDDFEVDEDDGPEQGDHAAIMAACSGTGCDNRDPSSYGCDASASTIETKTVYSSGGYWIKVDLRYSTACQTNWARMRTNYTSSKSVSALLDTSRHDRSKSGSINSSTNLWTNMEYCPTGSCVALACGYYGSYSACTGSW